MCFTVRNTNIYLATEDIECYKYLRVRNRQRRRVLLPNHFAGEIPNGYKKGRTYSKKKEFIKFLDSFTLYTHGQGQGFHSFTAPSQIGSFVKSSAYAAVVFVIPKGSYFLKSSSYYFSDSLRFSREIKTEDEYKELMSNGNKGIKVI